jgi:hypothetical protein
VLGPDKVTHSSVMAEMLELLKDPELEALIAHIDQASPFEKPIKIGAAIRAGYPEVGLFQELRVVHYLKGSFEFIDDFLEGLDRRLDSLGFTTTGVGGVPPVPADLARLREEIRSIDQDAAESARRLREELPQWARELVAALIDDLLTFTPDAIEAALDKLRNLRRVAEAALTILSFQWTRRLECRIGKDFMEDSFKEVINELGANRAFQRWGRSLTGLLPDELPSLKRTAAKLISQALQKTWADQTLKVEALAAERHWQFTASFRGMETSSEAAQLRYLVTALELVEEAVEAALRAPATFADALRESSPRVQAQVTAGRPRRLRQQADSQRLLQTLETGQRETLSGPRGSELTVAWGG